jgi:hypothetical protein
LWNFEITVINATEIHFHSGAETDVLEITISIVTNGLQIAAKE